MDNNLTASIFSIANENEFEQIALNLFRFHAKDCSVYRTFLKNLGTDVDRIFSVKEVPFLPIEFFKSHQIILDTHLPTVTFSSSGTTGAMQSKHFVVSALTYEKSFRKAFELAYRKVADLAVLALLPSYLEREGSSLIYMVDAFIHASKYQESGYFLYNHAELSETLIRLQESKIPTLLIGVSYALLDFVQHYHMSFPELIVMETGGMKGRHKEIVREELHQILSQGFGVTHIHSEYGMTELLSQAYSKGMGLFHCPSWMRVYIRDSKDPRTLLADEQIGCINIIDLANYYSCSFIATQDLGKSHADGSFEVLGRFDHSDERGCNLLI